MTDRPTNPGSSYRRRVDGADWAAVAAELDELDELGGAILPRVLGATDACELIARYEREEAFRSTVTMGRHRLRTRRGWTAAPVRHGVSVLRSGGRYTLGILFHDAR